MIEQLIGFAIKQRFLVLVGLLLLIGFGLYSLKHLPIDAVPDVTTNQVQINTEVPGLGPVDVEKLVTFPIESAMSGLPYIDEIRSLSKSAFSQVTVVFADSVDIYFARQLVLERLQIAKERIPAGLGQPLMGPISTGLGEIYRYTVEGKDLSPMELRTTQDWIIRLQLLTVPGITEVNSMGGFVKQYQVVIDPAKLVSLRIPLRQVFEALAKNNVNTGGAYIEHASEQYNIRGVGLVRTIEDIENIVVDVDETSGTPIFVKNLGNVIVGPEIRYGAATRDGKGEVVAGTAMLLKNENSRTVVNRLKKKIEEIKPYLPSGVTINPFHDRTDLVNATIHTVRNNITSGIILVVALLILLLGNWRGALLVAFSIPLTALFTFSAMYQAGIAASLMSLGALDFGIIVDGSVVMVENIVRHLSLKQKNSDGIVQTIHESAHEVGRPIFFAVMIIIIVYLPIATLQGLEGKMFKPMAFTMMFAMAGSLIIAITVIPVLCSFVFKKGVSVFKEENRVIRFIKKGYLPLLHKTVDHPRITIAIVAVCFFSSLALVPRLGSEFIPELDEGAIAIHAQRLPSVSLTHSAELLGKVEQVLMQFPEVETVVSQTGRAEIGTDPMGQELTDVFVTLKPRKEWKTSKDKEELINLMEKELNRIPGMRYSFSQPIEMRVAELIAGVRSDIAVKLFGDDLDILKEKAGEMERVVAAVRGAEDVKVEQVAGL
ncbi:MAG TPA: CusA/CzcA family heavy metal efflux RND transporter, partial [Candidatus Brocadiales bacterium]|nr:CusA/CzcA family heavy metal efflux RND transporter [Candidatus Brocadiales bacterium]